MTLIIGLPGPVPVARLPHNNILRFQKMRSLRNFMTHVPTSPAVSALYGRADDDDARQYKTLTNCKRTANTHHAPHHMHARTHAGTPEKHISSEIISDLPRVRGERKNVLRSTTCDMLHITTRTRRRTTQNMCAHFVKGGDGGGV